MRDFFDKMKVMFKLVFYVTGALTLYLMDQSMNRFSHWQKKPTETDNDER